METNLREEIKEILTDTFFCSIFSKEMHDRVLSEIDEQAFDECVEELETLINEHYVKKENPRLVRPAWEDIKINGYIMCSCGQILQDREQTRGHWQMGHFDQLKTNTDNGGEE